MLNHKCLHFFEQGSKSCHVVSESLDLLIVILNTLFKFILLEHLLVVGVLLRLLRQSMEGLYLRHVFPLFLPHSVQQRLNFLSNNNAYILDQSLVTLGSGFVGQDLFELPLTVIQQAAYALSILLNLLLHAHSSKHTFQSFRLFQLKPL